MAGTGSQILRDAAGDIDDHVHCIFEYAIEGYVDAEEIPPKARKKIALQFDLIIGNEFDGYGETVLGRQGSLVLENEQKAMLFHTSDVDKNLRVVEKKAARKTPRACRRSRCPRTARPTKSRKPSAAWPCKGPMRASPPSWSIGPSAASRRRTARPDAKPRCDAEAGLYTTVLTVAAAKAVKLETRVDFKKEWFDVKSDETPDNL